MTLSAETKLVARGGWRRRGWHTGGVAGTTSSLFTAAGLTKRYPGTVALDGLTVDVPRGRVGLVGANGAGKTTLFRLLLGLTRPTEGTLTVCGHRLSDDPLAARSRLGYMPEHDCLPLDQTAADVVADLRPGTRYDQVVEALGGYGELVTDPAEIGPAIDRALAAGVPALVNVLTDPADTYPRSSSLL